jgi:hypothetical protein
VITSRSSSIVDTSVRSPDSRAHSLSAERCVALHRRALWLDFTVGWNVVEAIVAIVAGVVAGSVALLGFGADSAIEVISALGLL